MSRRQIFSETEKLTLQELIIKYKLHTTVTGNPAVKKIAWTRVTEEYNSKGSNTQRTEAQLKKCWDNMKTRKKIMLALEKSECTKAGGRPYEPNLPGLSQCDLIVTGDPLDTQINMEMQYVVNSDDDSLQSTSTEDIPDTPATRSRSNTTECAQGERNIRSVASSEELPISKENSERLQKREEELHKLKLSEQAWLVKAAKEQYLKAKVERQNAEEILLFNRAKRIQAESEINKK